MAGAVAQLLVPALDAAALARWNQVVDSMSTMRNGNDFWVAPPGEARGAALPFFWEPVDEAGLVAAFQDIPGALVDIERTFGCTVGAAIAIGAMCRGRVSDLVLADLSLAFMKGRHAVLAFDGLLAPLFTLEEWRTWRALTTRVRADAFIRMLGGFPGRLHAFPTDEEPAYHVVDAEFLEFWRVHPAFHFPN